MATSPRSLLPALSLGAALVVPLGSAPPPSHSADVGVLSGQVIGLRNDRGVLRVALFNSASAWAAPGSAAVQTLEVPIQGGTATFRFSGLPYGTYALKGFQDEDRSGKLYTGLFGIPKVDVVFSNNVPIHQGPASFAKASLQVNQPYTHLVLQAQRL